MMKKAALLALLAVVASLPMRGETPDEVHKRLRSRLSGRWKPIVWDAKYSGGFVVAIDTKVPPRMTGAGFIVSLRYEYAEPQTSKQMRWDEARVSLEIDCTNGTGRALDSAFYRYGAKGSEQVSGPPFAPNWDRPMAETVGEITHEAVCDYIKRK